MQDESFQGHKISGMFAYLACWMSLQYSTGTDMCVYKCITVYTCIYIYIYHSISIYIYIIYAFMPRQETYHGNLWLSRCLLYGSPPQMVRRKTPPFHQAIAKPRKRRFPWGKSLQSIKGKQKSPVPPLNAINTDQLVDEEFRDQSSIRKPLHLA